MASIRSAGDRSFLVSFGSEFSEAAHHRVAGLTRRLLGVRGVTNLHPAYSTVLVEFDPRLRHPDWVEALIREESDATDREGEENASARVVEVPVRYGGEFGPDLEFVAGHTGLTPVEVVTRHAAAEYLVCFLGFSPGFPYLSGLPPELATPRLAVPRRRTPAGSVAIGGSQTGIYPMDSPGGWRIIGRTELRLFDPVAAPPALLAMGDRLRFMPVREAQP